MARFRFRFRFRFRVHVRVRGASLSASFSGNLRLILPRFTCISCKLAVYPFVSSCLSLTLHGRGRIIGPLFYQDETLKCMEGKKGNGEKGKEGRREPRTLLSRVHFSTFIFRLHIVFFFHRSQLSFCLICHEFCGIFLQLSSVHQSLSPTGPLPHHH